jgi:hypothetical protein
MARISAFVEPAAARPNNSKEDTQIGIYRYLWAGSAAVENMNL